MFKRMLGEPPRSYMRGKRAAVSVAGHPLAPPAAATRSPVAGA
jgi:hypothetical protein